MKNHIKPFTALVIALLCATNAVFALEIPERFNTGPAPYMIVFDEEPVALYRGGIDGLKATNPAFQGKTRLDPKSDDARAYVEHLKQAQQKRISRISQTLDRDVHSFFEMQHALNAAVLELTHAEAMSIQNLSGIRFIESYTEYQLDSVVSDGPFWIGADRLWDGSEAPNNIPVQGEGMVLGIIDSGVNSLHLSVAAVDPVDGYIHNNPLGSGNFLGVCDPSNIVQFDPTFSCNDKLIGAYDFLNTIDNALPPGEEDPGSPEDENNHGTHVGTTAGGNRNNSLGLQVQGVAPRANIIAYDACYTNDQGQGLCPFVSTAASINQAIADGIVDAINYSIGGGNSPWTETSSIAFLSAVESGIFVATSGGNSGPGPSTTGHVEPWTLSVAAATDNAIVIQEQTVSVTGPGSVPSNLVDMDTAEGSSPERIPTGGLSGDLSVFAANLLGCDPFPANTFSNQIALIQRGDCAFALKSENAANAGAVAMLLDNNTATPPVVRMAGMENATIPSVSITQADGVLLRDWLDSNPDDTTIVISDVNAFEQATDPDVIVNFSSRGPSPFGNLKPEIAAPGSNVFAPISVFGTSESFGLLSGTSMASPHVAGSAILVRQANPDWSVTEVKSALMSTAVQDGVTVETNGSDATFFDMGSGRVNTSAAANAGLVLNETAANFQAANPATGGDINSLNQAALSTNGCGGDTCTWTRTVRNGRDFQASWAASGSGDGFTVNVTPTNFELLPGDTIFVDSAEAGTGEPRSLFQQLEIVASGIPNGTTFRFGNVEFVEDGSQTPDQNFPVVVRQ